MGLDMYLRKHVHVGNQYMPEEKQIKITYPSASQIKPSRIDDSKINEIIVDVMYWRKANAIQPDHSKRLSEEDFNMRLSEM